MKNLKVRAQTAMRGIAAAAGATAIVMGAWAGSAAAAEWSDTSIGWRYGKKFREPFNPDDISKNILNLTHASGYKYGANYFNVDFLMSDSNDPGSNGSRGPGSSGAQEAYVVYRNTVALSKLTGKEYKYGGVARDFGATFGFDWNTKN